MVITNDQIAAATLIHDELMAGWAAGDRALTTLSARIPEMDFDAVMLKAAAINELYNVRCLHYSELVPVIGQRVGEMTEQPVPGDRAVELVTSIARDGAEKTGKWYWSFASKFVHWFVIDEAPMYDWWACAALKWHIPTLRWGSKPECYYPRFVGAIKELRAASGLACTARELDRYLWLSGMYRAAKNGYGNLSGEVNTLFLSPDPRSRAALDALMGSGERWRRGTSDSG